MVWSRLQELTQQSTRHHGEIKAGMCSLIAHAISTLRHPKSCATKK